MVRKFVFGLAVLVALFSLSTRHAQADPCIPAAQTLIAPSESLRANTSIAFEILYGIPNRTHYLYIGYRLLGGNQITSIARVPFTLDSDGYARVVFEQGINQNGSYNVIVVDEQRQIVSGDNFCSNNASITIVQGQEPPPPTENCRGEGDCCLPGDEHGEISGIPICDLDNFWCGTDASGLCSTGMVRERTCQIDGGCCRDENLQSGTVRYFCNEGWPSAQDETCFCSLYQPPPIQPPSESFTCGWGIIPEGNEYAGQPAFCVGGFTSQNPDPDYQVLFDCAIVDNPLECGVTLERIMGTAGQSARLGDLGAQLIPDPAVPGTYYTCFSGYWSEEMLQEVRNTIQRRADVCGVGGAGAGVIAGSAAFVGFSALPIPGSGVVAGFTIGGLTGTQVNNACIEAVNRDLSSLNILGSFRSPSGDDLCSSITNIDYNVLPLGMSGAFLCGDGVSIDTAIGCIPIDIIGRTVDFFVRWGIGMGGGVVIMLLILGAGMILTSTGRPERMKAGKELIGGAIAGVLLLVFAVFIMQVIGVDVLGLPEFGG